MGQRVAINVAVNRLIDDYPDILKETLLSALITDESIPVKIVEGANNSFNKNARNFYSYGERRYVEGLPGRSTFDSGKPTQDKRDAVIDVISAQVGEPIEIDNISIRTVHVQSLAYEWLQNTAGQDWDPINQILNHTDGKEYYLDSAEYQNGLLHLNMRLEKERGKLRYYINPNIGGFVMVTNVPVVPAHTIYYHVVYHLKSDVYYSRTYWNFRYVEDQHPTLNLDDTIVSGSTFFPIAPIRRNGVNVVDDTTYNIQQKKSVRRLLETIELDLDQMTESMVDQQNPEHIKDIDEIFVMFAMGLEDDSPMALSYLFESFKEFHEQQDINQQQKWIDWFNLGPPPPLGSSSERDTTPRPKNAVYVDDSTVSMQMEWNFTTMSVKNGLVANATTAPNPFTVAAPYTPNSSYGPRSTDEVTRQVVIDTNNTEMKFNDDTDNLDSKLPKNDEDDHWVTHSVIFRRQLTSVANGDATNTYEELLIHGLLTTYNVYRGPAKGRGEFVRDVANMQDGGFIIPVSRAVVDRYSGFDESAIYYQSLKVIVYAIKIKRIKWYQSGLFGALLSIVAIVIAIIYYQPWLGYAGLTGAAAVTVFILATFVIGFVVQKAFEVIAKVVGGEFALILAGIIAVYSLTYGDTQILGRLITAEDFLFLSNIAFQAANRQIGIEVQNIRREGLRLQRDIQEKQDALDEKYIQEFGDGTMPELFDIIADPLPIEFNMNIERWHEDKIGNGNPGVLVLDLPRTYHQIALSIPETVQRDVNIGTTLKGS